MHDADGGEKLGSSSTTFWDDAVAGNVATGIDSV